MHGLGRRELRGLFQKGLEAVLTFQTRFFSDRFVLAATAVIPISFRVRTAPVKHHMGLAAKAE